MDPILLDEPGRKALMMGNEAIARGALEAGVHYCAAYPGSPSSEILGVLSRAAPHFGIYAEWSANEKVALEGACGASFAGLRAMASMKQNGVNVASDLLTAMSLTGSPGGLVLVVCDDPGGISSTNEVDTRHYARLADVPLLEPATFQEAKDMVRWAFELSEELQLLCMVRSVTRISHARGVIELGPLRPLRRKAGMKPGDRYASLPPCPKHEELKAKLARARTLFEGSPFNSYSGPGRPELVVVTCGTGWWYAAEALRILGLEERVGILKLGTTWPLPEGFLRRHLEGVPAILIIEEPDAFLEYNVKAVLAQRAGAQEIRTPRFFGKMSGTVQGLYGPAVGEMNPDVVIEALCRSLGRDAPGGRQALKERIGADVDFPLPKREVAFCPGCPHRASYWVMKNALRLDGRDGLLIGDIGCYSLGFGRTGYSLSRTMHCMGSAIGFSSGMGQLGRFGFSQPLIAAVGDSTFFHACLPGLVSARYNRSAFVCVVLDNSATAMTGFQPHPGTGRTALGEAAPSLSVEAICQGMGIPVEVVDPFDVPAATELLCRTVEKEELHVLVFRHKCGLLQTREEGLPARRVFVDAEKCIGAQCGCNRFCSAAFGCPALVWDAETGRASIDEVVCSRCGLCAKLCPAEAIRIIEGEKRA
ncbi:MAG: thiamine pyrophosphate-dependent enzyme [bacterium]